MRISDLFKLETLKHIFLRYTLLQDVQIDADEKVIRTIEKTRVKSSGHGPDPTVFPNCKVILTDRRMIIAQKVLWQDKYKVHYFVWLHPAEKKNIIDKGMIHLSCSKENMISHENSLTILPDDQSFITELVISDFGQLD